MISFEKYKEIKNRIGEESTGTGYILVSDVLNILQEELNVVDIDNCDID